jgi:hypothetical protein
MTSARPYGGGTSSLVGLPEQLVAVSAGGHFGE